jgi:hypothetical protein
MNMDTANRANDPSTDEHLLGDHLAMNDPLRIDNNGVSAHIAMNRAVNL